MRHSGNVNIDRKDGTGLCKLLKLQDKHESWYHSGSIGDMIEEVGELLPPVKPDVFLIDEKITSSNVLSG